MQRLWDRACTPEANAKKVQRGAAHPKYKQDRSQVRSRNRYEGREWRRAVYERDNYTCQLCGERGGRLNADHILSYAAHPDKRWDVDNGRTLCVSCHKTTPTYGRKLYVSVPQ